MNALKFSTGVKTFSVNDGAAEISYNPTDVNFVSSLYDFFVSCAEKYESDKDKKFTDNTAFFEYAKQRDADVCAGIDNLFGSGTAAALFQGISTYAMAEGLPLWTNFLLAVIDTVPEEMSKQVKSSRPRVEKYLKNAVEKWNVQQRGMAIVMDVNSGAILAMAVEGGFDPNEPNVITDSTLQSILDTEGALSEEQKGLLYRRLGVTSAEMAKEDYSLNQILADGVIDDDEYGTVRTVEKQVPDRPVHPRFSVQGCHQRHGPGFRRGHDGHQLRLLRQL